MKANILKTKSTRYAIFHLMSSIRIQLSYLTMICVFSCLIKIWQLFFIFFCSKDITCLGVCFFFIINAIYLEEMIQHFILIMFKLNKT